MRLIDADAFAENLKSLHGYGDYEANMYCAETCYGLGNWVWENPEDYGIEAAEKALKDAPTIDAVEVIRCSKCEYGEEDDPDFPNQYLCRYDGCSWNKGEHFCGYGKPKMGGE